MTPDARRLVSVEDEEDARRQGLVYLGNLDQKQQILVEEAMKSRHGRRRLKRYVGVPPAAGLLLKHPASKTSRNSRKRKRRLQK